MTRLNSFAVSSRSRAPGFSVYVQPKLLVCGCAIDLTANRLDVIDKIERPGECLSGVTIGQCGAKQCVGHGVERRP